MDEANRPIHLYQPMISALNGYLDAAGNSLNTSMNRLSSGLRINSASDDPAGLQIASRMTTQISGMAQALNNLGDGISAAQTASGALGQVSNTLQQLRDLAVQSANGTNTAADRQNLQAQFAQLTSHVDDTAAQTRFNGQNLLDGTFNQTLQSGPNAGDTINLQLGNVSSGSLGLTGLDISTAAGSSNALAAIDQAIQTVGSQQASTGAIQSSLQSASANLQTTGVNLSASRGAITDTDYAQQSSDLAAANVKQQAAIKVVALYNAHQASVLSLLPPPRT